MRARGHRQADHVDMSIRGILTHRASVARATTTNVNGAPHTTFATIATAIPVLLDATQKPQDTAQATSAQTTEPRRTGLLMAAPEADIRPGDRLVVGQPGMPSSTWLVQPAPSYVTHMHGEHHREFQVTET